MNGHGGNAQGQFAFDRVDADPHKYPEQHKDHANLLMKEGLALNIQLYYEHDCRALIPTEDIEQAIYRGDAKSIFQKVSQRELKSYMAMIFNPPMNGGADNPINKNPYVFVEKCSL